MVSVMKETNRVGREHLFEEKPPEELSGKGGVGVVSVVVSIL